MGYCNLARFGAVLLSYCARDPNVHSNFQSHLRTFTGYSKLRHAKSNAHSNVSDRCQNTHSLLQGPGHGKAADSLMLSRERRGPMSASTRSTTPNCAVANLSRRPGRTRRASRNAPRLAWPGEGVAPYLQGGGQQESPGWCWHHWKPATSYWLTTWELPLLVPPWEPGLA